MDLASSAFLKLYMDELREKYTTLIFYEQIDPALYLPTCYLSSRPPSPLLLTSFPVWNSCPPCLFVLEDKE